MAADTYPPQRILKRRQISLKKERNKRKTNAFPIRTPNRIDSNRKKSNRPRYKHTSPKNGGLPSFKQLLVLRFAYTQRFVRSRTRFFFVFRSTLLPKTSKSKPTQKDKSTDRQDTNETHHFLLRRNWIILLMVQPRYMKGTAVMVWFSRLNKHAKRARKASKHSKQAKRACNHSQQTKTR